MTIAPDQLTDDYARAICGIGQGQNCCRYLTAGADGWRCQKHTDLGRYIDGRVERKDFTARGDNCEGIVYPE